MIKGINKQIIEMKCTNNEYFEKVLLFVKADKAEFPQSALKNEASALCDGLYPEKKLGSPKKAKIFAVVSAAAALVGGICIAVVLI